MNDAFRGEFRISIVAVGREPSGSLTSDGLRWAATKLILTRRFNAQFLFCWIAVRSGTR